MLHSFLRKMFKLCKNDAGRGMILYIDSFVKYSPINRDNDFQEYICIHFHVEYFSGLLYTVKPVHAIISIKQSPVLTYMHTDVYYRP
jgi:hypothetical protein